MWCLVSLYVRTSEFLRPAKRELQKQFEILSSRLSNMPEFLACKKRLPRLRSDRGRVIAGPANWVPKKFPWPENLSFF